MQSRIAFCTTNKNRTLHLKQTLPKNIEDNKDYDNCVFIIVDYNSQDDLHDYLRDNHKEDIKSGKVVVYHYKGSDVFQMGHAKNLSHRCGILEGGEILCNLDADGYTGKGFANYINQQFRSNDACFQQALWNRWVNQEDGTKKWLAEDARGILGPPVDKGSNGRMVISKNAFLLSGGYDEKYITWSSDDKDLNIRLRRLGFKPSLLEREYQETILHNDKIRFKEYPHVKNTKAYGFNVTVHDSNDTIANFGSVGCGTIWKNFDFKHPIELLPIPTRIFGVGFHKTATTSLYKALNILGYNAAHWNNAHWAKRIYDEMIQVGKSITLERHYALSDLPIAILYEQLDKAYPGSKFILTIRDDNKWLESIRRHWSHNTNPFRHQWDTDPFSHIIHKEIYGRRDYNAEIFLKRYKKHNSEVLGYFKHRIYDGESGDLLILDMEKDNTWNKLCKFLNTPTPKMPYPKVKY
jgi:Sulfotransferase domain